MKKLVFLIVKGICVLMPVIFLCIYTWRNPLNFMDEEAPYYLWNKEMTNHKSDKYYGTVILGDSTANAAYVPEILSDDTINLSLGGMSPVENYYVLQDWLEHNQAPKHCYISFIDFHFQNADCFWARTMYSHRFRTDQNLEMLRAAIESKETSIAREGCIADFISYELYLPNKYITSLMNAGFNQRYEGNVNLQKVNELHRGHYIARGVTEYAAGETITADEFCVYPFFDRYYRKLIELCMENGIQVHIIKLPLPDNHVFTETYRSDFYVYYENLKEDYPGLTVDWFPIYEKSYFADSTHMNSHGALRFSSALRKLYPDVFLDSRLSMEQVAGINAYISEENKIEQILEWIAGKDYTVILNDGTGKLASMYAALSESWAAKLHKLVYGSNSICESNVFYISGMDNGGTGLSILDYDENGLMYETKDGAVRLWESSDTGILRMAVIDHYNQNVFCLKSFRYTDEDFILAE